MKGNRYSQRKSAFRAMGKLAKRQGVKIGRRHSRPYESIPNVKNYQFMADGMGVKAVIVPRRQVKHHKR